MTFLDVANFNEKNALVEPLGETPHLVFPLTSAPVPARPSLSINPVCVLSHAPPAEFPPVAMTVASSKAVKDSNCYIVIITDLARVKIILQKSIYFTHPMKLPSLLR